MLLLSVNGEQTLFIKLPASKVLVSPTLLMRLAAIINRREAEFRGLKRRLPLPDPSPIVSGRFISHCETVYLKFCVQAVNPARKGCARRLFSGSSSGVCFRYFVLFFFLNTLSLYNVTTFSPSSFVMKENGKETSTYSSKSQSKLSSK